MSTPLVSIGLPVYNGRRFIEEALDSILAQTFTDFELIISDNASTDGTAEVAEQYAKRDSRIRLVRNERNMGAAYNYNRVTALSTGKYIRHAAHDDVLAPTNIERCVEVLESDPSVALAYPQMSRIDANGKVIDTFAGSLHLDDADPVARWRSFVRAIDQNSMCDPVFGLFRADVLRSTPVLRTVIGADMLLLGDVALRGRIIEIPEVLFFERWYSGTSVNANHTLDDRASWFDPTQHGNPLNAVPHWRWLTGYIQSIASAPLQPSQRVACVLAMTHWIWVHKRGLALGPIALAARAIRSRPLNRWFDRAVLGIR